MSGWIFLDSVIKMVLSLLLLTVMKETAMKQAFLEFTVINRFSESFETIFNPMNMLLSSKIFHHLIICVLHSLNLLLEFFAFIIVFFNFLNQ